MKNFLFFVVFCFRPLFSAGPYIMEFSGKYTYDRDPTSVHTLEHIHGVELEHLKIYEKKNGHRKKGSVYKKGISYFYRDERGAKTLRFDCEYDHFWGRNQSKVFDVDGNHLANVIIDWDSKDAARFVFSDPHGHPIATARLDSDCNQLTVRSPDGSELYTCEKQLKILFKDSSSRFPRGVGYKWEIRKHDKTLREKRIFWPFFAYIADQWWRPPPPSQYRLKVEGEVDDQQAFLPSQFAFTKKRKDFFHRFADVEKNSSGYSYFRPDGGASSILVEKAPSFPAIYTEDEELCTIRESKNDDQCIQLFLADSDGDTLAKATFNLNQTQLLVTSPSGKPLLKCTHSLQSAKPHFSTEEVIDYHWDIEKRQGSPLNDLIFCPFLAYVADHWMCEHEVELWIQNCAL